MIDEVQVWFSYSKSSDHCIYWIHEYKYYTNLYGQVSNTGYNKI